MKSITNLILAALTLTVIYTVPAKAQQTEAEKRTEYQKTIFDRSAKIVKKLDLTDSAEALKVTQLIAKHYSNLNDIYADRDTAKAKVKREYTGDKEKMAAKLKDVEEATTTKVDKLHPKFLAGLKKAGLTPEQIEGVKDGLTYNVLHVTYKAYTDEVAELTEEQKTQIMVWLVEAREHSMDAESSNAKHAWFGKYKGRINNYLSKAGYDMRKEEADWKARGFKAKNAQAQ